VEGSPLERPTRARVTNITINGAFVSLERLSRPVTLSEMSWTKRTSPSWQKIVFYFAGSGKSWLLWKSIRFSKTSAFAWSKQNHCATHGNPFAETHLEGTEGRRGGQEHHRNSACFHRSSPRNSTAWFQNSVLTLVPLGRARERGDPELPQGGGPPPPGGGSCPSGCVPKWTVRRKRRISLSNQSPWGEQVRGSKRAA